jgi:hypothetical protein
MAGREVRLAGAAPREFGWDDSLSSKDHALSAVAVDQHLRWRPSCAVDWNLSSWRHSRRSLADRAFQRPTMLPDQTNDAPLI